MLTRLKQTAGQRVVATTAAWFLTFGSAYLFCVASDARAELCYGVTFGLAGALLVVILQRADHRSFTLTPRAILVLLPRAAMGAAKESWLLLGPRLCAQLLGRAPDGRYIRIAIDRGQGDSKGNGRVAGVLWVQAFTPNAIPLFVDRDHVVLHQLIHHREPNADDCEFPA